MKKVGIRTLNNRIGKYFRVAQAGEWVRVTSRATPIMDLIPHPRHGLDPDDELRLARAGKVRPPPPNAKAAYSRPPLLGG